MAASASQHSTCHLLEGCPASRVFVGSKTGIMTWLVFAMQDHIRGSSSVANILEGCLEQLQELTTPDDLMEFVHGDLAVRVGSFSQVDAPERAAADSSSIMGMFLRQCTISFDSLSFEVGLVCLALLPQVCEVFGFNSEFDLWWFENTQDINIILSEVPTLILNSLFEMHLHGLLHCRQLQPCIILPSCWAFGSLKAQQHHRLAAVAVRCQP